MQRHENWSEPQVGGRPQRGIRRSVLSDYSRVRIFRITGYTEHRLTACKSRVKVRGDRTVYRTPISTVPQYTDYFLRAETGQLRGLGHIY